MALKFLNKKGWHTGSLRNIENVWKAEQKHDAEQKKLEELRKQIHEERERSEFRQLQEQAGLVPRQERLEFLYDSGLAVGKGSASSSGGGGGGGVFKALEESLPTSKPSAPDGSSNQSSAAPGALFEDKPQSANDAWRKLHSDPLLMIRQREQEALARIKNNPVQMALIRKSAQEKKENKGKDKSGDKKESRKKASTSTKHRKHSSKEEQSDSEVDPNKGERRRNNGDYKRDRRRNRSDSENESFEREHRNDRHSKEKHYKHSSREDRSDSKVDPYQGERRSNNDDYKRSQRDRHRTLPDSENESTEREHRKGMHSKEKCKEEKPNNRDSRDTVKNNLNKDDYKRPSESHYNKRKGVASKLSEEERAARLREMQEDAEVHEEQRWKRLKKAEENDAREATRANDLSNGKNFLDAAHRSVYGAEKGGSSTVEESVRRRTHYLQGRTESEGNAFRRR